MADGSGDLVIGGLVATNTWRDFRVIAKRAGLEPWSKPCHTLRKNCETDWSAELPLHIVTEWLGNSPAVAIKHYIRAENTDFEKITAAPDASRRGPHRDTREGRRLPRTRAQDGKDC